NIMGIISTCLQFFIFWEIYKALYGSNTEIDGITMSMVTTNFILSMGLGAVFSPDDYFLPSKIWDGSIATEFLRPISFKGRMIAENVGSALFNLLFRFVPCLIIALFTVGVNPPASPAMLALFVLSAILGFGVLWTISFAVQMTAFWLINIWSLITIKNVLINVLSGSMIPLWFMPKELTAILNFMPFSSVYFTPVQIYLGQLSFEEIALKCGIQLAWIIVIYLLGDLLWRKGQKKLIVQGG
ncbi:MAG: ABC-2 family transporter protein, partial [Ruminiclostridium sp.]|nr:ABC-2 family transporter protein [Ruminiclostridium sp.]